METREDIFGMCDKNMNEKKPLEGSISPEVVEEYYDNVYAKPPIAKVQRRREESGYARFLDLLEVEPGKILLDIACGSGGLLAQAERRGLCCYGVDISGVALAEAQRRTKATLQRANVNEGLPYPDNYFDYITCLGSLEHFQNQAIVITEMHRVSKISGKICILVPNNDYILHKLHYEVDKQPIINRYSPKKWRELLENNGLLIQTIMKENTHLENLSSSSTYIKHVTKILMHPFVRFIPLAVSYNIIFICTPWRR
ncbi:class I SAM-dependent methyltransferase [Chloroflexota bacterium]